MSKFPNGHTLPADTPTLIKLKRCRQRADELIRNAHVGADLNLLASVSELTREYQHSRRRLLAPADRLKLTSMVTPTVGWGNMRNLICVLCDNIAQPIRKTAPAGDRSGKTLISGRQKHAVSVNFCG